MRKALHLWFMLILIAVSCNNSKKYNYLQHVNILTGTAKSASAGSGSNEGDHVAYGQTIPAVTAPFGMTQWTPQTHHSERKCLAPFYTGTTFLQGFRATHWTSGSCVQDYGSFTIFPTSLKENFSYLPDRRRVMFLFEPEVTSPASFVAHIPDKGIIAELTATKRAGFMRFSWLDPQDPTIIIDVNNDEGEGYIHVDLEQQEIIGYNPVHRIYNGWGEPAGFSGYFVARFDKEIMKSGTYAGPEYFHDTTTQQDKEKIGAFVTFRFKPEETLKMKMGTSFTSIENARENMEAEIPDWNFEQTKKELENTWSTYLGRIHAEGGTEEDLEKFYTALYHSLIHPRLYSDVNGEYPGFGPDSTIHKIDGASFYGDFSNWDIFRAQMPLLSLIAPEEYEDMVNSLVAMAEQGGWLPIFPMWNSYTSAMIGDHSTAIISDAIMKGFHIDIDKAYAYMHKNAYQIPADQNEYADGKGRRALTSYLQFGYIPLEDQVENSFHQKEQVSRTLEYAYNDWAVAQVAQKLGKTNDYNDLKARSYNYINVFDPDKGWVCGRNADGTFTGEFEANGKMPYITEGTPKQYTWFVPHDVAGLIETMGGKEKFSQELVQFFANREYWHGNEPGHHVPWLFNYTGQWDKTQETVKEILKTQYGSGPEGLPGNDDAGQLSAWYVFGAMGFYPVCPGSNEYQLSSPIFEKITLDLDKNFYPGSPFVIETDPGNQYGIFSGVSLNNKEIKPVITHNDLQNGGFLKFTGK